MNSANKMVRALGGVEKRSPIKGGWSVRGFTLIELVVVVGVLVLLASLIVPNLDAFKLKANKGVAAADMGDLSRIIQQHYVIHATYPDNWDSLFTNSTGGFWQAPAIGQPGLDSELTGGPVPGSPQKLTTTTISSDGYLRSLTRIGIVTVLDLGPDDTLAPSDRFTLPRTLANGSTIATINPADDDGKDIIRHFYPTQATNATPVVPDGKLLMVVGVGPRNGIQGDDIQDVPYYPNRDISVEYARFLAVFEADAGGAPARLKGVIGADGDTIVSETVEYYQH